MYRFFLFSSFLSQICAISFKIYIAKKHGLDPLKKGKGRKGRFAVVLEHVLGWGFLLWLFAILIYVISPETMNYFYELKPLDDTVFKSLGTVFMVAGYLIAFKGLKDIGLSWRVGVDYDDETILISGGIYKFIRHPIYSGGLLVTYGTFLIISNLLFAFFFVSTLILFYLQAKEEERFLMQKFGNAYDDYKKKTGMFLPKHLKNG